MAQPYVGEIRMFGGSFAPVGWMTCDGQVVPISGYEVLFNLVGTTYGGDGQQSFALPDLRGRVPLCQGAGSGLSVRTLGSSFGTEQVTLTTAQAGHSHPLMAAPVAAPVTAPAGNNVLAQIPTAKGNLYSKTLAAPVPLAPASVSMVGGSQPHENRMPLLCVTFIISMYGIYPSQA